MKRGKPSLISIIEKLEKEEAYRVKNGLKIFMRRTQEPKKDKKKDSDQLFML